MSEFEKFTEPFVDKNYSNRDGYDSKFLGKEVPIPNVADDSYLAKMDNGEYILPYTHFSIIMHKERKLALLTVSNVDASEKAKKPEEGQKYGRKELGGFGSFAIEKWLIDPRIPEEYQLPDKFYTKDRKNFDKGHIVRRDDVVWGSSYEEVKRANGDTYHTTNCSPQVEFFNRSNRKGDWGKFENNVLKQAKLEKLCIISGPVLDDENDKIFNGYISAKVLAPVQIPSKFWKIVVAKKGTKLQTFAFLLEQDLSQSDVEFNVDAEWLSKMISMEDLQKELQDIVFQKVYFDSDQYGITEIMGEVAPTPKKKSTAKTKSTTDKKTIDNDASIWELSDEDSGWNKDKSPDLLIKALKAKDFGKAEKVLKDLNNYVDKGARIDGRTAKKVLQTLKSFTWFDQLKNISDKLQKFAQDDIIVFLYLAQSKIELGELSNAIQMLKDIIKRIVLERSDMTLSTEKIIEYAELHSEALGLLGRAYKQYYINASPLSVVPRTNDVDLALEFYTQGSRIPQGDVNWHKVNIIALYTKKERVSRSNNYSISPEAETLAKEIIAETTKEIKESEVPLSSWQYGNLVEANLAIGETVDAINYLKSYLTISKEPFQVLSSMRQLIDMYMLNENSAPGDSMIPLMKARYAELGGKSESTRLDVNNIPQYEKVYGQTPYKSMRWLLKALKISKSIVRLGPDKYNGTGTGFVFEGSWISEKYKDNKYIMTNAHVCSDDAAVRNQFPNPDAPEDIVATFLGKGSADLADEIKCLRVAWTSPPSELDATLIEIESFPNDLEPIDVSKRNPPVSENGDSRLNILGHPKGLDMRVSLQDNTFVEQDDTYVWYKTPTDGGSSGSPVFNQDWKLVALHHASSSAKRANEGIRIDVLLEAIRKEMK
jgi:DNA/RNA endonuclease G (NUC1)